MTSQRYLLDNAAAQSGDRFASLAAVFDPITRAHIDPLGIGPGWRCWEVGAGGTSIPSWLAERTGPGGYVLATDVDTTWMTGDLADHIEVRVHDVAADPAPDGLFDLVHARLVLVHVPRRDEALRRMVSVLKPGGWLVLEDFDTALVTASCLDPTTAAERRANVIRRGFVALLAERGVDLEYGRKLPRVLRDVGLVDVRADAYFPVADPATRLLERANTMQVAEGLVGAALATQDDIAAHLEALAAGEVDVSTPPLVSAWGRRA